MKNFFGLQKSVEDASATVVCLHSSGSSSRQWSELRTLLSPKHSVLAVDLHGHGAAELWTGPAEATLDADAALVGRQIAPFAGGVHLVGHSYGGAVALRVAMGQPHRVRSLVLYEPVPFGLLLEDCEAVYAAEIVAVGRAIVADVTRGDTTAAAARFVDYWSGPGAWQALAPFHQAAVVARIGTIAAHFRSLLERPAGADDFGAIRAPVLLLHGDASPRPIGRLVALLEAALPQARSLRLERCGHMAPVTNAPIVNRCVETFLATVAGAGRGLSRQSDTKPTRDALSATLSPSR